MTGPDYVRGKALWLRSWQSIADTPRAAVDRYVAAGFSWVSPIALWGGGEVRQWRELHDAFADADVPVWPLWGLPEPETWRGALPRFVRHAVSVGARGVVVDPEVEWKDREAEAAEAAAAIRQACDDHGLALAITSYSLPSAHRAFPWGAWLAVADVGIAQTYDRDLRFDPRYPVRARDQWAELAGPDVQIVCAGGLWNHAARRDKTPAEVRRHLAQLPPQDAAIFWSDGSIPPGVWRELKAYRPRRNAAGRGGLGPALAMAGIAAYAAFRRARG